MHFSGVLTGPGRPSASTPQFGTRGTARRAAPGDWSPPQPPVQPESDTAAPADEAMEADAATASVHSLRDAIRSGDGALTVFRRTVPAQWQLLGGAAATVLLVGTLHMAFAIGGVTWPLLALHLLAIVFAASCGGLVAGLTAAAIVMAYHFAAGDLAAGYAWIALLAIATLSIATMIGLLRDDLGRIGEELASARRLLKAANARIDRARETEAMRAYYDPMTDLPTRRLVIDRFGQMLAMARRAGTFAAVMLLDLNRFAEVNERFGHDIGDEVLRGVGQRLTALMRRGDTVGRLEGDKFVVLLAGMSDRAGVDAATQKMFAGLGEPLHVGSPPREVYVSAAVGIAVCPDDGETWEDLYSVASEAVRVAKGMR